MADVAAAGFGQSAFVTLSVIALFSTANTVLILLMSSARLLYGMAEDGMVSRVMAQIHGRRRTPYVATVFVAAASMTVLISMETIGAVANLTNFTLLATFVIINAAVIVLRFTEPDTPRPFHIPGNLGRLPIVPVLGVVSSLFLLVQVGLSTILLGVAFAGMGVPVFLISRRHRRNYSGNTTDKVL
jgi:APA family basic amino acid/polyamine antiporter